MPLIRFTADPKLPRDLAHLDFKKGVEVELSDDKAGRWLRRGVAEIVTADEIAARRRAADKAERDAAEAKARAAREAAEKKAKADADTMAADTGAGGDTMPSPSRSGGARRS